MITKFDIFNENIINNLWLNNPEKNMQDLLIRIKNQILQNDFTGIKLKEHRNDKI